MHPWIRQLGKYLTLAALAVAPAGCAKAPAPKITKPAYLESRKLGAARMTARYISSDPVSPADLKALVANYDRELTPVCKDVLALQPVAAIGTSGTMENLAAMCAALYGSKSDKAAA